MKIKSFLWVATFLGSIAVSYSQNNYSTNVVGFCVQNFAANQGLLIANQFNTPSNTLMGLIPSAPLNSSFTKYVGGDITYHNTSNGWSGNTTMNPGESGYFTAAGAMQVAFYGKVLSGPMTNSLPVNSVGPLADMVPLYGYVTSQLGLPAERNDTISFETNGVATQFLYSGTAWTPSEPWVGVGQVFWFANASTATNTTWVQSYSALPYSDNGSVCLTITQAVSGTFTLSISGAPGGNTYYIISKPYLNSTFWSYETTIAGNSSASVPAGSRTTLFLVAVNSMADGDTDGIPDWWLLEYFGHPTGQSSDLSRAQDDADGEGLTNLQEFILGTNPRYMNTSSLFISTPRPLNVP